MLTEEQVKLFLEELTELTRKHSIEIGGCGCCGSPFLSEIEDADKNGHYVSGSDSDDYITWRKEQ